jgi:hypothetical protein
LAISGTIGGGVPAGSRAILLFSIDTGTGDGLYKWGEGTSADGATYEIAVVPPPPSSALLVSGAGGLGLGLGFVAIVPSDLQLPDGPVADPAALMAAVLGMSNREAVVWRSGTFTPDLVLWPNEFPERTLACGTCVDNVSGFDAYAPTACTEVHVTTNLADPSCNWS